MNALVLDIQNRFIKCKFTHPLTDDTVYEKILSQLNYKSAIMSRGGKLIVDFSDDDDFIVKIDLRSKVSSLTADQYYFIKNHMNFYEFMAPITSFEINGYYLYIQDKITPLNSNNQYNLCQLDNSGWQRFLTALNIQVSRELICWCKLAATCYGDMKVKSFLFILRQNNFTDLNPDNLGIDKNMKPKLIDF